MGRRPGVVIKSERELALMREAGQVNARALAAAVSIVRPGITTKDLDSAAAEVLRTHGAEPAFVGVQMHGADPYPAVTTISVNDELVHGIPGKRRLKSGDIVSIDCGSIVEGFVADSALTVGVGEISEQAQKLIDVTLESLYIGIAKLVEGNRTGDVSAAIQEYVERNGFNVVREYTSHGVGRSMHEDPQVPNFGRAGHGLPLKSGMTIALEPMVLAGSPETRVLEDRWTVCSRDGHLTAHFEHSVAITVYGPKILTALDGDLDELGLARYNRYFAGQQSTVTG
ncbi:MAG: type I methionyl aminopeptidase [Anaerolineales bacterium]|nr:type I methionyl aminopeptidase [Anaerolineales bacterium]